VRGTDLPTHASRFLWACLLACLIVSGTFTRPALAESGCTRIPDPAERLACYDRANTQADDSAPTLRTEEPHEEDTASAPSIFSRRWEQDAVRKTFDLTAYRPSYVLPISYNTRPNNAPYKEQDPDAHLDHNEIKFQISFQLKIDNEFLGSSGDLWFSYTQRSWWQAYNKDFSSPFRETNYEPELVWSFLTDYTLLGLRGRQLNFGIVHQSNGRSEPLSRSWNRIYASIGFERDNFALQLKPWWRIPENSNEDDNPDITDYMGHGEIWAYYHHENHLFALMLRNVEDMRHGGVELDWTFPIARHLRGLVQLYNGYGESLIDYDHSNHRIGIGLLITDWL